MVGVETDQAPIGRKRPLPYPKPTHPDPGYCVGCGPDCPHCATGPKEPFGYGPLRSWDVLGGGWQCGADNEAYLASLEDPDWREAFESGDASPLPAGARPSWDEYFGRIARVVASRADCIKRQHGCLIVDLDHRIVSTGYNGPPRGDSRSCTGGDCPRGQQPPGQAGPSYDNCIALHAEQNAIAYAGRATRGSTAYLLHPPCDLCGKLLQAAGVVRVVVADG